MTGVGVSSMMWPIKIRARCADLRSATPDRICLGDMAVSSRAIAEQAAKEWIGLNAEPTVDRTTAAQVRWKTGESESAGINRHVVGDERALQERKAANPSWPRVLQATSRGAARSVDRGIGGPGY